MLTELRFESYKDFVAKVNEFNKENYNIENVNSVLYFLEGYSVKNFFLLEGESWEIFTNIHIEFYARVVKLRSTLAKIDSLWKSRNVMDAYSPHEKETYRRELKKELEDHLMYYDALKLNYSSFLQKVVSGRSIGEFKEKYLKKQ